MIMGLFSSDRPKEERQADVNRYKAAKKASNQIAKNLREEGPATMQANEAVIDAEREIPWWRR
jgi:hypothetical protein